MDLQESERNPNFISVDVEFCSCDHNIQIQDSSIYWPLLHPAFGNSRSLRGTWASIYFYLGSRTRVVVTYYDAVLLKRGEQFHSDASGCLPTLFYIGPSALMNGIARPDGKPTANPRKPTQTDANRRQKMTKKVPQNNYITFLFGSHGCSRKTFVFLCGSHRR